jgi:hypothetical protein
MEIPGQISAEIDIQPEVNHILIPAGIPSDSIRPSDALDPSQRALVSLLEAVLSPHPPIHDVPAIHHGPPTEFSRPTPRAAVRSIHDQLIVPSQPARRVPERMEDEPNGVDFEVVCAQFHEVPCRSPH